MVAGHTILFYDGVFGLCSRLVAFLLHRDRNDRFRFASLQSGFAREKLAAFGKDPNDLDTVYVLTPDGRLLDRSRAILFAAATLGGAWRLASVLRLFPTFLLNAGYRLVARTRYRLFGRYDACRLPSPQEKAKFIEV